MTGLMSAHETFQQAMDVEIREEVSQHLYHQVLQTKQCSLNEELATCKVHVKRGESG